MTSRNLLARFRAARQPVDGSEAVLGTPPATAPSQPAQTPCTRLPAELTPLIDRTRTPEALRALAFAGVWASVCRGDDLEDMIAETAAVLSAALDLQHGRVEQVRRRMVAAGQERWG